MSCISLYLYYIEFSFTQTLVFFCILLCELKNVNGFFPPYYNPANPVFKGFSTNYNSVPAEIFQPLAASKRLAGKKDNIENE